MNSRLIRFIGLTTVCLSVGADIHAAQPAQNSCPPPAPPSGPSYFLASEADTLTLLPPPPAADSPTQQRDIQAVLDAQSAARAAGTTAHAVADAQATCARFDDVLGEELKSKRASKALAFVTEAALEGAGATSSPKRYWKRPRPYVVNDQVERLADMAPDAKPPADLNAETKKSNPDCAHRPPPPDTAPVSEEKKKADKEKAAKDLAYSSYPSGHSAFGTICSILLADMVPEKRAELFARGRDYGASRLVVGAHFPDDVESGRIAGTIAVGLMMQNAKFQHDLGIARSDLRAALNLPAELPDLEPNKEKNADIDKDANKDSDDQK